MKLLSKPLKLIILLSFFSLPACVSLDSVSLSTVPQGRSHAVEGRAHDWTLLGIAFNNNFANEGVDALRAKCPQGKLDGILSKQQNTLYFIMLKREAIFSAFCSSSNNEEVEAHGQ